MKATEVKLGADASNGPGITQTTPTVIDVANAKAFGTTAIVTTLAGAIVAFLWSKHKKHDKHTMMLMTVAGAAAGYFGGKYIQAHIPIKVQTSK